MSESLTGSSGQLHPYLRTLRAHRVLFALPVVVAAVIATWFVLGAAKQYQAGTSLWFDNAPSTDVTVTQQPTDATGAVIPPAAQGQTLLNELLATRHFRLVVGHESPLGAYLASHHDHGWSPTALLGSLRKTPSLENRIVDALGTKGVTTKVIGPQVLSITLNAADPAVSSQTLNVLVREFNSEAQGNRTARGRAAVAYYRDQVQGAEQQLTAAHAQVDAYLAAHPGVKPCSTPSSGTSSSATSSGCSDLRLRALTDADRAAAARLVDATGNLNQASINLQSLPAAGSAFRVVDAPRMPTGPVAGMKKAIVGIFAGIFAGVLASALGVAGITSLQRAVRPVGDAADADDAAGPAPAARRPIEIEVFGDDAVAETAAPPPAPPAPAPAAPAPADAPAPVAKASVAKAPATPAPVAKAPEPTPAAPPPPAAPVVDASSLRVGARVEPPAPERREPRPAPAAAGGDGRSATDDMVWDAAPPPPPGAARLAPVPAGTNGGAHANGGAGTEKPAEPKAAEPAQAEPASAEPAKASPKPATPAAKGGARGRRGAFSGTVVRVRVDGTGPKAHAVWSVRPDDPAAQPTPGSRIHVATPPGYGGLVRTLRDDRDGGQVFEVEITAARPAPGTPDDRAIPATDPRWLGTEVAFAPGSATSARTPSRRRSPASL